LNLSEAERKGMSADDAIKEIIEKADLVSEVREMKHPYNRGVKGRKGIEY
jgi:cob(I)alamin adenosyltransferase